VSSQVTPNSHVGLRLTLTGTRPESLTGVAIKRRIVHNPSELAKLQQDVARMTPTSLDGQIP